MSDQSESSQIKIRYEDLTAVYAGQVILNTTESEFLLDFSSGVTPDPETGEPCLPVHTRIAMSRTGAMRLHSVLGKALEAK